MPVTVNNVIDKKMKERAGARLEILVGAALSELQTAILMPNSNEPALLGAFVARVLYGFLPYRTLMSANNAVLTVGTAAADLSQLTSAEKDALKSAFKGAIEDAIQAIVMKSGDLSTDDMLDRWKRGSAATSSIAKKAARALNIDADS